MAEPPGPPAARPDTLPDPTPEPMAHNSGPDQPAAAIPGPGTRVPTPETAGGAMQEPIPAAQPAGGRETAPPVKAEAGEGGRTRKGPLSFLTGSITSLGLGWLALQLSFRVVGYYADHPPHYTARFAQSIATFVKTLVVGMSFLATFTFAFVGLGLFLTFLRSLMPGWRQAEETP